MYWYVLGDLRGLFAGDAEVVRAVVVTREVYRIVYRDINNFKIKAIIYHP